MARAGESAAYAAQPLVVEAARLEAAARAARKAGDYVTARARFEGAIALLGAEDPAWRTRLHVQLSRMLSLAGDSEASLREAERAVRVAPPGASDAIARARLAVTLSHAGRAREAHAAASRALDVAVAAGDSEAEGIARMALGYALRCAGLPRAAADEVRSAVPLAAANGDDEAVVARLIDLANSLHLAGEELAAVEAAAGAVAEARRRGVSVGMPAAVHALHLFNVGQWQSAMRAVDDGMVEEPRFPWLVLMRSRILVGHGELRAAQRLLTRAERLAAGPRAGGWDGPHETAAELLLWSGDSAGALGRVREALETVQLNERNDALRDLLPLGLRAAADLRASGAAASRDARQSAAGLIDLLRRHGATMRQGHPDAVGTHLPALEALAEAEYARAIGLHAHDLWQQAAELLASLPDPWHCAYARLRQVQAVRRSGDAFAGADVDAALADAHRTSVRLRAKLLQRAVEGEAAAWGRSIFPAASHSPSPIAPREPRGLTQREREVFALLGAGSSNRQIARQLGISEKTVSVHIGNITGKLGVANRLEAAAVAIRLAAAPTR